MRHSRWLFFLAWWPEFTSSWGEDWWASSSTGQSGPPPPPDHRADHSARGDGRLAHSSQGQRGSNTQEGSNWHYHQRAPAHMFAGDGHGNEVGLRGASKEVQDVETQLYRMRAAESSMERDLADILHSVMAHSHALVKMEDVLAAAARASASKDKDQGAIALSELAAAVAEHPTNLTDLGNALLHMRHDLRLLLSALNGTAAELEEVRALTGQKELVEGLLGGELEVDYETGEIASVIGGARYGSGSGVESSFGRRGSASGRQGQHPVSGRTNSTSSSSSSSSYDGDDWQHQATALSEDVVAARMAADPAVLHLDVQLLQDMVVLCLATAIGGLLAALVDLPHTLGYILGGMLVGPSCSNFIVQVVQTETLAQFGSIFMLFGHGLVYSQHYRHGATRDNNGGSGSGSSSPSSGAGVSSAGSDALIAAASTVMLASSSSSSDNVGASNGDGNGQHLHNDTVTGGFFYVACLFVVTLFTAMGSGVVSSWLEGTLSALAISLSSTAVVMDTLAQARLRDTLYGTVVIELMAVQDLFMAPLLAIPTALSHIVWQQTPVQLVVTLGSYGVGIAAVVLVARWAVPRSMELLSDPERRLAPQLFTLAVASYCLGMSLLSEWLELSHEAGALFAGLVLMDTPHVRTAAAAVEPLTALFGGMYLASLGMIMSPAFLLRHLTEIMLYVAAIYVLKVTVVTGVMRSFGFAVPAALSAGVILAQVSEVSLFFVARAQQLGLVGRHVYLLILATTVTLLAVAPLASNVVKRVDKRMFKLLDPNYSSNGCLGTDNTTSSAKDGGGNVPSRTSGVVGAIFRRNLATVKSICTAFLNSIAKCAVMAASALVACLRCLRPGPH